MNNRIRNAFDDVKANESLKENTKAFICDKTKGYKRYNYSMGAQWKMAVSVLVLMLFVGSFYTYFTPVAAISVDSDSSLELKINRFNKVIAVDEYSESGEVVSSNISVQFKDYNEVIEEILVETNNSESEINNEIYSITVLCDDEEKNREMLSRVEQCNQVVENQEYIHCYSGNSKLAKDAHIHGMATGKYRAYLELQEQNPEVEMDDVADLSMRDIYTIIDNHHGKDKDHNHHTPSFEIVDDNASVKDSETDGEIALPMNPDVKYNEESPIENQGRPDDKGEKPNNSNDGGNVKEKNPLDKNRVPGKDSQKDEMLDKQNGNNKQEITNESSNDNTWKDDSHFEQNFNTNKHRHCKD